MRKPVQHNLEPHEHAHLVEHHQGGLMRKVLPDEVANKLITSGYLRKTTGGHVVTDQGMAVIYGIKEQVDD